MADQQPTRRAPKDAWKGANAAAKPAAARRDSSARPWRAFYLLAGIMALVGATVAWLTFYKPPKRPALLPLLVTEYGTRLPPYAQGDQDRVALEQEKFFDVRETTGSFNYQTKPQITRELSNLAAAQNDSVVVYLSAYALSGEDGKVNVLPAEPDIDKKESWLGLEEILNQVKICPAKHKLLVLDIMRPLTDPRLGVLADDLARRVHAALDAVPDERRLVLCSCSPGQVALTSETLGQSVFGYYVVKGLEGWAHRGTSARPDRRVTVRELAQFVQARVDRWAEHNLGLRQTPVLIGTAEDFELTVLKDDWDGSPAETPEAAEAAEPIAPPAYPDWLRQGWAERDRWWDRQAYRAAPRAYRQLEAELLRAERRWRGGVDAGEVRKRLQEQLARLKQQLGDMEKAVPQPAEPTSLALAVALGHKPDPKAAEALKGFLSKRKEAVAAAKPGEADKAGTELQKKFLDGLQGKPPFDLAWAVFEAADAERPTPERVRLLNGLLAEQQRTPQFVETLFLRRLAELADQLGPDADRKWPHDAVRRAFDVVREGERAIAADPRRDAAGRFDARAFRWVQGPLERAAQKRHDAEVLLFSPGYAAAVEADALFQDAAEENKAVLNATEVIQDAARVRDEALALLPGLARAWNARPESADSDAESWKAALAHVRQLDDFFANPPGDGRPGPSAGEFQRKIREIKDQKEKLQDSLKDLRRPYTENLGELRGRVKFDASPSLIRDLDAALEVPWLRAEDRVALWGDGRGLARRFQDETLKRDQEDDQSTTPVVSPAPFDDVQAERADKRERENAARRAQLSLDLLRLGGLEGVENLEDALAAARKEQPPQPTTWPPLAQQIRHGLADVLPRQLQNPKNDDASLVARDRLARLALPLEAAQAGEDDRGPGLELRRRDAAALWRWLENRYRYEGLAWQGLAGGRDFATPAFYERAARDLRPAFTDPLPLATLQFRPEQSEPNLRDGARAASYTLGVSPSGPAVKGRSLETKTPGNDWLQVGLPEQSLLDGGGPWQVPLKVQLRPGAEDSPVAPPEGFLVVARADGRSFTQKVRVLVPAPSGQRLHLLLSDSPKDKNPQLDVLRLRPNARQPVYVYVKNPSDKARKVVVEVKAGGPDGALSKAVDVGPKQTERVYFAEKPPAPAGDKADAELPPLAGPLVLRLLDVEDKNAQLDKRELKVAVANPQEYVRVTNIRYKPGEKKNRLVVNLRAKDPPGGQPCTVKLVLLPDRIPGLIAPKAGTFEVELPPDGEERELSAEDLQFDDTRSDENGFIYLTVDGYERAFIYQVTFDSQGQERSPAEITRPELRLRLPALLRPTDRCPVIVEADNAPPGARLAVALDVSGNGTFSQNHSRATDRRQHIGFSPQGPDGGLLLQTVVADWVVDLRTSGIFGRRLLRSRMLKREELVDPPGTVEQPLVLDNTPAEEARILRVNGQPPDASERTLKLLVTSSFQVQALARDADSGVKEVNFFLGEQANNAVPATAKPRKGRFDPKAQTWSAELPVPGVPGETKVTVQVVNGVGISVFDTVTVDLFEKKKPVPAEDKADAPPGPTGIKGKVVETGDGPAQANARVLLLDQARTKVLRKTATNDAGEFAFAEVEPGTYRLHSDKGARKNEVLVEVKKGETATATLKLSLVP